MCDELSLSRTERTRMLQMLADVYGFTVEQLLEEYLTDSVSPGICTQPDCGYTCEYEPDQAHGWCEECGTGTVVSAFVLAGII